MYHSTDVPHVINRFFASVMQNPKRVPRFSSCAAMMLVLQAIDRSLVVWNAYLAEILARERLEGGSKKRKIKYIYIL